MGCSCVRQRAKRSWVRAMGGWRGTAFSDSGRRWLARNRGLDNIWAARLCLTLLPRAGGWGLRLCLTPSSGCLVVSSGTLRLAAHSEFTLTRLALEFSVAAYQKCRGPLLRTITRPIQGIRELDRRCAASTANGNAAEKRQIYNSWREIKKDTWKVGWSSHLSTLRFDAICTNRLKKFPSRLLSSDC